MTRLIQPTRQNVNGPISGARHAVALLAVALLAFVAGLIGCASNSYEPKTSKERAALQAVKESPAFLPQREPIAPVALMYSGNNKPIIKHLFKRGPAFKAGFRLGDQIVVLNGTKIFTASDFDLALRTAKKQSVLTYRRGTKTYTTTVILTNTKPRFGADFEPEAVALVKKTSPHIAYMHLKDITAYAQTSLNQKEDELHLNMIIESTKILPMAQMSYSLTEKGKTKPFAKGVEQLDALGSDSRLISKAIKKSDGIKGPFKLSLNVDHEQFVFEFQ